MVVERRIEGFVWLSNGPKCIEQSGHPLFHGCQVNCTCCHRFAWARQRYCFLCVQGGGQKLFQQLPLSVAWLKQAFYKADVPLIQTD